MGFGCNSAPGHQGLESQTAVDKWGTVPAISSRCECSEQALLIHGASWQTSWASCPQSSSSALNTSYSKQQSQWAAYQQFSLECVCVAHQIIWRAGHIHENCDLFQDNAHAGKKVNSTNQFLAVNSSPRNSPSQYGIVHFSFLTQISMLLCHCIVYS